MENSDSESSFYDETADYQLEDDGNDDRVLVQPGILANHGEPLDDDSNAQDKENFEANDPTYWMCQVSSKVSRDLS